MWTKFAVLFLCVLIAFSAAELFADTFGSGANQFTIDFVTIGNPGNPADTTGNPNPAGSVPYVYRIGKYEISHSAVEEVNAESGLGITQWDPSYAPLARPNSPASQITWYEAARFANWLNTSTGSLPAYKFDEAGNFQNWSPDDAGYDPDNLYRNRLARYFLPSVHEWYKAAYYDPVAGVYWNYPTGSDSPPTSTAGGTAPGTAVYLQENPADVTLAGGPSPYGTVGQGGNAWEWEETDLDLLNDSSSVVRGDRGGSWISTYDRLRATVRIGYEAWAAGPTDGFRVASVYDAIPGDLNEDAVVNTADYVLWRSDPTSYGGDPAGYNTWRANFGQQAGNSVGASAAIPEPASIAIFSIAAMVLGVSRFRTRADRL